MRFWKKKFTLWSLIVKIEETMFPQHPGQAPIRKVFQDILYIIPILSKTDIVSNMNVFLGALDLNINDVHIQGESKKSVICGTW